MLIHVVTLRKVLARGQSGGHHTDHVRKVNRLSPAELRLLTVNYTIYTGEISVLIEPRPLFKGNF